MGELVLVELLLIDRLEAAHDGRVAGSMVHARRVMPAVQPSRYKNTREPEWVHLVCWHYSIVYGWSADWQYQLVGGSPARSFST